MPFSLRPLLYFSRSDTMSPRFWAMDSSVSPLRMVYGLRGRTQHSVRALCLRTMPRGERAVTQSLSDVPDAWCIFGTSGFDCRHESAAVRAASRANGQRGSSPAQLDLTEGSHESEDGEVTELLCAAYVPFHQRGQVWVGGGCTHAEARSRAPNSARLHMCDMLQPLACPLRPQVNEERVVLDLSGLWDFQVDAANIGEASGYSLHLPRARLAAVPGRRA